MLATEIQIRSFDRDASEAEMRALNTFWNHMLSELLPNDPPAPLEQTTSGVRDIPAFFGRRTWVAWQGDTMVGRGAIMLRKGVGNEHLANCILDVLPEWRRQGLGRRLLALLAEAAAGDNRRLLMAETYSTAPAGAAFMTRLSAHPGLTTHINQLAIADLDPDLLTVWQERATERAKDFLLELWKGRCPEADLTGFVDLWNAAFDLAPRDSLDLQETRWNPARYREFEEFLGKGGWQHWTLVAREQATAELAGFTDVTWNPATPMLLFQGGTVVWPQYQNRGLGRWLKAAMLAKVLRDRPAVRYVQTGNADSNQPMLHINTALGFRPYVATTVWQVEIDQVRRYLAARA
jgi:mycothiol synthase